MKTIAEDPRIPRRTSRLVTWPAWCLGPNRSQVKFLMLIRLIVLFMFLLMGKVVSADEVICHPPPKDLAQVIYSSLGDSNMVWVEVIIPKVYDTLKFSRLTMRAKPKDNSTKGQLGVEAELAVAGGCGWEDEYSEDLAEFEDCHKNFSTVFELSNFRDSLVSINVIYEDGCVSHLNFIVDPLSPEAYYRYPGRP